MYKTLWAGCTVRVGVKPERLAVDWEIKDYFAKLYR
jgi:hypothetical protein